MNMQRSYLKKVFQEDPDLAQREVIVPNYIIADENALKIHGIGHTEISSDSDSGKSDFDEDYYQYRPNPIVINKRETVVVGTEYYSRDKIKRISPNNSYSLDVKSGQSPNQGPLTRRPNVAKGKKSSVLGNDPLQDLKDTLFFINSNIISNDNQFSSIKESHIARTISSAASSSTVDKKVDTPFIRPKYDSAFHSLAKIREGGSASEVPKYPTTTMSVEGDFPPNSETKCRTSPNVENKCIYPPDCDRTLRRVRTYNHQAGINKPIAVDVKKGKDFSSTFPRDNRPRYNTNMFENAMPFNISGHIPDIYVSSTRKSLSNSITKSNEVSEARYGQKWSRNTSTCVIPKTLFRSVSVREYSNLEQQTRNSNFNTSTEIPTRPSVVSEQPVLIQDNMGNSAQNVHINSTEHLIPEDYLCKGGSFFRFLCCIC